MPLRRFAIPIAKKFRKWARKRTRPLSQDEAEEKREFFARAYMLSAVSLFGVLTFITFKSDVDLGKRMLPAFHKQEGQDHVIRIIKFSGTKKIADYIYDPETDDETRNKTVDNEKVDTEDTKIVNEKK